MAKLADKIISGRRGSFTAIIDGNIEEIAEIQKLTATATISTYKYKAMGEDAEQTKNTGWSGSGTMTVLFGTPAMRKIMFDYIKTGKTTFFEGIVENDDQDYGNGAIRTRLGGITISEMIVAMLDVDTEMMTMDIPFTLTEVEEL